MPPFVAAAPAAGAGLASALATALPILTTAVGTAGSIMKGISDKQSQHAMLKARQGPQWTDEGRAYVQGKREERDSFARPESFGNAFNSKAAKVASLQNDLGQIIQANQQRKVGTPQQTGGPLAGPGSNPFSQRLG